MGREGEAVARVEWAVGGIGKDRVPLTCREIVKDDEAGSEQAEDSRERRRRKECRTWSGLASRRAYRLDRQMRC